MGAVHNVTYYLHNFWVGFFWKANNSVILFRFFKTVLPEQLSDLASSLGLYVSYLKTETK